jgi:undecaprenyl diphosphate synthase
VKSRIEIHISGRVQGVHFRGAAKTQSDKLQVTGYAKNQDNGTVEIIAEGEESALEELLHWCFRGSLLAKVTGLTYNWKEYLGEFSSFDVIRTNSDFIKDQIHALKNLGKNIIELPDDITLPKHIAIIPDGNRRWAKEHDLPSIEGHKKGAKNLIRISKAARKLGIKHLTVWGFSTENWKRDDKEVGYLMSIFKLFLNKYAKDMHKDKVRFTHIGRKDRFEPEFREMLLKLEQETASYDSYFVNVALDYGGQDEILRAIGKAYESGMDMTKLHIDEFSKMMDTYNSPDPDLIIRTSGEKRLSGLMPWQSTYAEFYFPAVHFPDFDENELKTAILEYSYRSRRFGK